MRCAWRCPQTGRHRYLDPSEHTGQSGDTRSAHESWQRQAEPKDIARFFVPTATTSSFIGSISPSISPL